jgi:8-hydroxy-5-deazaflavin:NADPH oxidoreductase
MKKNNFPKVSRREFTQSLLLSGLALATGLINGTSIAQTSNPLRIGIIGSGRMGGAVGLRWAEAGHAVFFSSRNPDQLDELVQRAGNNAQAGFPAEAVAFGDVILVAVPYGALPQIGEDYAAQMAGKIVIDCGNPRADRDGPMADDAIARGTGIVGAEYLPGTRLVRALNAISFMQVNQQAHREGELIGVPIAGDDPEAVRIAIQLVSDAGFDPVVVGGLDSARRFDRGTEVYVRGLTAREIRDVLNL